MFGFEVVEHVGHPLQRVRPRRGWAYFSVKLVLDEMFDARDASRKIAPAPRHWRYRIMPHGVKL
eukprot:3019738-Pyramimonas_sp.AAC.1